MLKVSDGELGSCHTYVHNPSAGLQKVPINKSWADGSTPLSVTYFKRAVLLGSSDTHLHRSTWEKRRVHLRNFEASLVYK